jgi:ubiquinone/menaquinone biosynthesis C-methylase UbiE
VVNQAQDGNAIAYQIKDDYQTTTSAEWYKRQYATSMRARLANWGEQRAFQKLLKQIPPGQTILDIACGTGRFTQVLLEHGHRVAGSDISDEMLRIAERELGGDDGLISLDKGDAEALPFDAGTFDGIVCMRLYQRVPEASRQVMLQEVRRVGRGWAILFFGMSTPWLDVRRQLRNKVARRPNLRYPVTPKNLKLELQKAGLTPVKQEWAIPFLAEGLLILVKW